MYEKIKYIDNILFDTDKREKYVKRAQLLKSIDEYILNYASPSSIELWEESKTQLYNVDVPNAANDEYFKTAIYFLNKIFNDWEEEDTI